MPGVLAHGKYPTTGEWLPILVDSSGRPKVDMSNINLNDLADVDVSGVADDDLFYYDSASGLWKSRKLVDADIPAGIARDAEVDAKIAASEFIDHPDTPAAYTDQARKLLAVNAGEDALEFISGKALYAIAIPKEGYYLSNVSGLPRTATIDSISTDTITLTGNHAYRFFDDRMEGNSYLKIANTDKSPTEYAWVKATPAANQLQVTDSTDISGWSNGETISTQRNDTDTDEVEVDLSPLLPEGTTGIFFRYTVADSGTIADDTAYSRVSASGVGGTWIWAHAQVSGISSIHYPFSSVDSNRHILINDRAAGTDTLRVRVHVLGYVK